jgi:hypothetical protein
MVDAVSSSPASVDELVEFIASFVENRYRATHQATNGALIAEEVRHRFPNVSYVQLGLVKLADAVAHGEAKGLLVRNREVKHLEVLPAHARQPVAVVAPQVRLAAPPHIRADIWRAFVYVSQGQQSSFDRQTGNVVSAASAGDQADPPRYIPILCIPMADQQQWMVDFVATRAQLTLSDAPIHDQFCFTKFPAWLREHEPGLDRLWKQFRAQRVAERVRQWATANAIEPSGFFSAPISPSTQGRSSSADPAVERAVRAAVVAAARELPVEQLQEISIPIRLFLQALKSR